MSGSRGIEHAYYIQRLLEKKMDKVNPEQSFHCRVRDAMAAMDEQFGDKWRQVITGSGVPAPDEGEESFFDLLQKASEAEGIGEPPLSIHAEEEAKKVTKHKQDAKPTIFILVQKHLEKE